MHKKIFFLALLIVPVMGKLWSQTISITPENILLDNRFSIKLSGLKPGEPVIIRARITDSSHRQWQSFAGFYADAGGSVDLDKQSPVNGSYNGINGMGLVQFMTLPAIDLNRGRFLFNRTDSLPIKFTVEAAGKIVAEKEVLLNFHDQSTSVITINTDGLKASLFMPGGNEPATGIIVLGGSEGGLSGEDIAAVLSSHGYAAMALAYFGLEGLPSSLEEIPIEYFKKAIDQLMNSPRVKKNGIILFGTSKGAEAALIIASIYKEVMAVVAYAPSNVAWSCICNTAERSSWSYKGKSIPYIPLSSDPTYKPAQGFPIRPSVNYLYRYNRDNVTTAASQIAVEKIKGPVMVISGKDDGIWPSDKMANEIMLRLKKHKHPYKDVHLSYPMAGHLIGKLYLPSGSTLVGNGRLETGGTVVANANAQAKAWPLVLDFLKNIRK